MNDLLGAAIVLVLGVFEMYILWRYPDFRREFFRWLSAEEMDKRIRAWLARQDARRPS